MELYLVKPDLMYFDRYNEMMCEWIGSGTQIAPWFLGEPFENMEAFADFVRMLDRCSHGFVDERFAATTSYFVMDENGALVGAASLRHYLTVEGLATWGHIGYGVRPAERRKGYATRILKMMLEEAGRMNIRDVLLGAHTDNIGSCRVIEKCGGVPENIVPDPGDASKTISRYWIRNRVQIKAAQNACGG